MCPMTHVQNFWRDAIKEIHSGKIMCNTEKPTSQQHNIISGNFAYKYRFYVCTCVTDVISLTHCPLWEIRLYVSTQKSKSGWRLGSNKQRVTNYWAYSVRHNQWHSVTNNLSLLILYLTISDAYQFFHINYVECAWALHIEGTGALYVKEEGHL